MVEGPAREPASRLLTVGPQQVLAGKRVLRGLGRAVSQIGQRTAVIAGERSWSVAGRALRSALEAQGAGSMLQPLFYGEQVSEAAIERLGRAAQGVDSIVAVGGGKSLDAGKLVADRLGVPVFTVPTSAATCAAWTALSNVYSEAGGWLYGVPLEHAPRAVFLDYDLLAEAPVRLLASGVLDAMAKWYEADSAVDPALADVTTAAALELSHYLHKQLVRHAKSAMAGDRDSALRVIDLNVLLAGSVSGLGGPMCRSVVAHAVANGLTHLPGSERSLHGEKVAFGLLTQFVLQDRDLAEIEEFLGFLADLRVPLTLRDLGSPDDAAALELAVSIALHPHSTLHRFPAAIDATTLTRALLEADALAQRIRAERALTLGESS